jgi:hypothetical protein
VTCDLVALCFGTSDPVRVAGFWAGLLGWDLPPGHRDDVTLVPADETGFRLRFVSGHGPKTGPNRMHLDLTSTSVPDQKQRVKTALALGGRHVDVGQRPDEDHVVLADPEGNELCVVGPGNTFLADCGLVGAVSCDGSQQVGYFWSEALGWPLVWDQDEETAIRSPHGGPKIAWGGPPVAPKAGRNRLWFDVAPPAPGDRDTEVERLLSLGARRIDGRLGDPRCVALADPDDNEFGVRDADALPDPGFA